MEPVGTLRVSRSYRLAGAFRQVSTSHATVAGVKTLGSALVIVVFLAGCGGDHDEPSLSARETAQEWVDAVNAEDYDRACDLSVFDKQSLCLDLMRNEPFGADLKVWHFTDDPPNGDAGAFLVSSAEDRKVGGPAVVRESIAVERDGDQHKVHFEVSIIK